MDGNELISKIILSLNAFLGLNNQDVIDAIDLDNNIDEGINLLKSLSPPPIFIQFLDSLVVIINNNIDGFLTTPYPTSTAEPHLINFNQPVFEKKNRGFAHSNVDFGFVSSKLLFENNDLIDFSSSENSIIWKQVEEYLLSCYTKNTDHTNNTDINNFLEILRDANSQKGLVINKNLGVFNENKHYSFIYLSYLNDSNAIKIPTTLLYSPSTLMGGNIVYDNSKNYEQYFDIYDVINELNQAPDILNRFLKLYHIMEYLVYRVYLVNLVGRLNGSKFFVREFISSSESMKKNERDSFKKNFKEIFASDLNTNISPTLSPMTNANIVNFLKDKNIVKGFDTQSIDKIAEFIYGIRCCIVHNKESEYHITISNHEDYEILIPLLKKTIIIFEKIIIEKIIDNDLTITYSSKTVKLY